MPATRGPTGAVRACSWREPGHAANRLPVCSVRPHGAAEPPSRSTTALLDQPALAVPVVRAALARLSRLPFPWVLGVVALLRALALALLRRRSVRLICHCRAPCGPSNRASAQRTSRARTERTSHNRQPADWLTDQHVCSTYVLVTRGRGGGGEWVCCSSCCSSPFGSSTDNWPGHKKSGVCGPWPRISPISRF
jgi:hypothetical protein